MSLDLKRQWAFWELEVPLCQHDDEEATVNEEAKIIHSRKNLYAKVACAKAVIEAKYNYRVAIQEARMIRSNQLQESEITYSKALGDNATMRSTQSMRLHREHIKLMHKLEEQAIREESKSHHDLPFCLSSCILHPCSCNPSGRIWLPPTSSYWGNLPPSPPSATVCQGTPGRRTATCSHLSHASAQTWSPWPKRQLPLP